MALACDKLASKAYVGELALSDSRLRSLCIPAVRWTSDSSASLSSILSASDRRMVVKPNHSSGRYAFVDAHAQPAEIARVEALVPGWMQRDEETLVLGHWGYGEARVGVFAEERVGGAGSRLVEIRCAAFDGVPDSYVVTADVYTRMQTTEAYDADFRRMRIGFPTEVALDRPGALDALSNARKGELRDIVAAISAPYDHVRVDIYDDGTHFWFGELTVYPSGGALPYTEEVERARGAKWRLPRQSERDASQEGRDLPSDVWLRERPQPLRASTAETTAIPSSEISSNEIPT